MEVDLLHKIYNMEQHSETTKEFSEFEPKMDSKLCRKCGKTSTSGVPKIERLKMAPTKLAPKTNIRPSASNRRRSFPGLDSFCGSHQIRKFVFMKTVDLRTRLYLQVKFSIISSMFYMYLNNSDGLNVCLLQNQSF